jgi:hypothetical protein
MKRSQVSYNALEREGRRDRGQASGVRAPQLPQLDPRISFARVKGRLRQSKLCTLGGRSTHLRASLSHVPTINTTA